MPDSGGAWQGGQVDDGIGQRAGGDTLALLLWGKLRFSQVVVPTPLFRVLKPLARRLARSTYNYAPSSGRGFTGLIRPIC